MTAGGALLARLKAVGVDYIFANSGTDFPPIIEGLAEARANGIALPEAIVIPHESVAVAMAHGYYLASGRSQAVMAHTNVGLANCAMGAINAAAEQIPMLLLSGRTPTLEKGRFGARTVPIGWGQEMRDQHALVREASKWDYELRFPEQIPDVVDRAFAIANSTPRGPVYVSVPREVLCEVVAYEGLGVPSRIAPSVSAVDLDGVAELARAIRDARRPLIVAQRGAGSEQGFAALDRIARDWAIPVSQYWAVQLALATDHPFSTGAEIGPWVEEADLVVVLDCLAPWSPAIHVPSEDCKIFQVGADPLYERFPFRNFPSDRTLTGEVGPFLVALEKALNALSVDDGHAEGRRADTEARCRARRENTVSRARAGHSSGITKEHVSFCLSQAMEGHDVSVLSELGCPLEPLTLDAHRSWFQEPHSGGLGWSFPAALGMKLAQPRRLVVATMGDGSYLFSNPVACHQIAEAMGISIIVIVLNNSEWGAVRQSVADLYPKGHAAQANIMPLTSLGPTPDFTMIAGASRAYAQRVEKAEDLPAALEAAIAHVSANKGLTLVEVSVLP
ncbi:MAG: thiamine pyrophosphate-requiring protein [Phyllobacterium sp.]